MKTNQNNQTKQLIEMHKKYKTRDGRPVRILCVDREDCDYPVVALVTNEKHCEIAVVYSCYGSFTGTHNNHVLDLIEVQPWDDFKIDDQVLVKEYEEGKWKKRYFAGVSDRGLPLAFKDGCTSWSSEGEALDWNFCKKPDQE